LWNSVGEQFRFRDHIVDTIEFPAHGNDRRTPANGILKAYVDRTIEDIDATNDNVSWVGNNMGGVVVSGAVEQRPERVSRLIYVAALLPQDGDKILKLGSSDTDSKVFPALLDGGSDGTFGLLEDLGVSIYRTDHVDSQRIWLDPTRLLAAKPSFRTMSRHTRLRTAVFSASIIIARETKWFYGVNRTQWALVTEFLGS
jgi:pimeloyl-ACP methyl ester carboxylesterase